MPLETEAGAEAVRAAAALKKQAYSLVDEAREQGLLAAARAYGQVADTAQFGRLERVESAFRSGEILRARGLPAEANSRFAQSLSLGEGSDHLSVRVFASRALLEQAHQARRVGQIDQALELYDAVRIRFSDCVRACTHAISWSGKTLLRHDRVVEAQGLLLDFEAFLPDYALDAVRNAELLADTFLELGQPDQAIAAVSRLEAVFERNGESMTDAVEGALGALRDKLRESGYSRSQDR